MTPHQLLSSNLRIAVTWGVAALAVCGTPDTADACSTCSGGACTVHCDDTVSALVAPPGPFHIGLDFLTEAVDPGPSYLFDFEPFALTTPTNYFVTQGAFAGRSETEVQRSIALAVEDAFRALPGLGAGQASAIAIHIGRVPTTVSGRRLNVAIGQSSSPSWTLLGEARQNTFAAAGTPNDSYVAAAYVDQIDGLGASFLNYNTFGGAINAIAGTIAHEVGHVFGAEHVAVTGSETGPLPLMAIEATGLPTAARLTARTFDLSPQFSPPNATRILENGQTVLQGDFNLDGLVDAADINILLAGFALTDRLYIEGDATGDHMVDAADIGQIITNWSAPPALLAASMAAAAVPEPGTLALAVPLLLAATRRRRRRRG